MTTPLHYVIDFSRRQHHVITIRMWIQPDREEFTLAMPVWTPGSYMVREYSRNIESISASGHHAMYADPECVIPLSRHGKNQWSCRPSDHGNTPFVCVTYQLYCREMSVRTNWVEHDYAFLTGAATFLYVVDRPGSALVLLDLPADWQNTATSLEPSKADGFQYVFAADSHDQLVDSPIVCGNFETREFEVGGVKHCLANVGGDHLWDLDLAVADTKKIVSAHQESWGCIPYPHYWFINLVTEGRGGLEHDDSTALMCSRYAMKDRDAYVDWLGLVSHEFFHTWNIRRLRPKSLMRYDYQREQHTEELWIAEGITSYFDDLSIARLGLCTIDEYLARLSKTVHTVQSSPGRRVQNLQESSWDAWTKLYRPDENSPNSRISYYSKGALVSWLLDIHILAATNGDKSLNDVLRQLWSRCLDTGYTQSDFDDIVQELAGTEVRQWLQKQLSGVHELDFQPALDWLGLIFEEPAQNETKARIGVEVSGRSGSKVSRVLHGTPADQAGLNVDDELLALDGFRIDHDSFHSRWANYKAGTELELLIARRGKVQSLTIRVTEATEPNWQLVIDPRCTPEAEACRATHFRVASPL